MKQLGSGNLQNVRYYTIGMIGCQRKKSCANEISARRCRIAIKFTEHKLNHISSSPKIQRRLKISFTMKKLDFKTKDLNTRLKKASFLAKYLIL